MPEIFDPYYKWLGIPPAEQPPNHYRLLGVNLFESDTDVIASAADQRMSHLRSFQTGEYSQASQRLLNEVATARLCLLDPGKKRTYDEQLRRSQSAWSMSPGPTSPPPESTTAPRAVPPPLRPLGLRPAPSGTPTSLQTTSPVLLEPPQGVAPPETSKPMAFSGLRLSKWLWPTTFTLIATGALALAVVLVVQRPLEVVQTDANGSPDTTALEAPSMGATLPEETSSLVPPPPPESADSESLASDSPTSELSSTELASPELPVRLDTADEQKTGESAAQASPAISPFDSITQDADPAGGTPAKNPWQSWLTPSRPAPSLPTADNIRPKRRTTQTRARPESPIKPASYQVNLPSGAVFQNTLFRTDEREVERLITSSGRSQSSVLTCEYPSGSTFAFFRHEDGNLEGTAMAYHENEEPLMYATYRKGERHGILKMWNEAGENLFWCQYGNGKRHGFCCLFKDNRLCLLVECQYDDIEAIHVLSGPQVLRSYTEEKEAREDDVARVALERIDDAELETKRCEREYKQRLREEELELRRQRVAKLNPQKRRAIQQRSNNRAAAQQQLINSLRRRSGI